MNNESFISPYSSATSFALRTYLKSTLLLSLRMIYIAPGHSVGPLSMDRATNSRNSSILKGVTGIGTVNRDATNLGTPTYLMMNMFKK
jgi:hypothetical protein